MKYLSFIFTIMFFVNSANAKINAGELIPRKIIFGNPEKANVQLSEDGKFISFLSSKNGILNIWIAPSDKINKAICISNEKNRNIHRYYWSYDNRHILYFKDNNGDENDILHIYNIKSKKTEILFYKKNVKTIILKRSIKYPSKIIIGTNERKKEFFDIYELDLKTLKKKLIFKNDKFIDFVFDDDLKFRFGYIINQEGGSEIYLYNEKKKNWNLYMKADFEDVKNTDILGFHNKGDSIYITDTRDSDTIILKSINLKTQEIKTLYQNKLCDINSFIVNPQTKEIEVVKFEYLKPDYHILKNDIREDIEVIKKIDKGEFLIKRNYNDKKWLVIFISDTNTPKYYLYDRKKKNAKFLFYMDAKKAKYKWNKMEPIIIKSRDGLDLVCYLSLPNSHKLKNNRPDKQLPMVLMVHGGPNARDSFGFNNLHQLLTNRGYAVLSVNFRGSTGFGKKFINAGNKEWGNKMHNDLIDAVNWAIKEKIADAKKIAIFGGSYGGYASLVGLTFTPDVFACGIDIVGPSNLYTLLKSIPSYWKPAIKELEKRIGSSETKEDIEFLKKRSPLTYANKIKKPLLIAQGEYDPRVKKAESEQIVNEMKKHKIPVIYALYKNEGHGFRRPQNKFSFYAIMEQFLSNIIGGEAEPIGDAFDGAHFLINDNKPIKNKEFYK